MTPPKPGPARDAAPVEAAQGGPLLGRERLAPEAAPVPLTHRALCLLAGRWLRTRGCTTVLVEPAYTRSPEMPDAIGWRHGWRSILVEAKVSRADFLADQKKPHRAIGYLGRQVVPLPTCPRAGVCSRRTVGASASSALPRTAT